MPSPRIKIYTRSMSTELYRRAISFVDLPYPKERVVGSTSLSYLLDIIHDLDADVVINVDEDAFVTDVPAVARLVEHVIERGFVNCGMPDGGVVPIRHHHPLVTNPFFTIMNTSEIRKKYRSGVFKGFPTMAEDYLDGHPAGLLRTPYDLDGYEPYNEFFVWLARTFPTLYLDAQVHPDGRSTVLLDTQGEPFLIHTWFARKYLRDVAETRRIDSRIEESARLNPAGTPLTRLDKLRHWIVPRLVTLRQTASRGSSS